jgi:hypothetical protein
MAAPAPFSWAAQAKYPMVQEMQQEVVPQLEAGITGAQIEDLQVEATCRAAMLPGVLESPLINLNGNSTPAHGICIAGEQEVNWDISQYPDFNPALQHLNATDMLIFTTRDPTCQNIIYDPALTTNRTVVYNWIYSGGGTPSIYDFPLVRGEASTLRTSGMVFNGTLGNRSPHGPFCIARGYENTPDYRANYLDGLTTTDSLSTSSITVELIPQTGAALIGGGSITIYKANYGAFNTYDSADIQAGVLMYSFPITESNYYAIRVSLDPEQTGQWTAQVVQTNVCTTFAHIPTPFLYDNENSIISIMTISAGTLWTNQANELYQQGSVWSYQCPPGDNFLRYINPSGTSVSAFVARQQGFKVNKFKLGSYVWTKPNGTDNFRYRKLFRFQNENATDDTSAPIDMVADIAQDCIVIQTATCSVPQGCDSYIRYGYNGQIETPNPFFSPKVADLEEETCTKAMSKMRRLPNLFENPTHGADIEESIAEIGKNAFNNWFGAKWAPVGKNIGEIGGKILGGLGRRLNLW